MLPTKKSQALLAYLAIRPGHAHSREKLTSLLWDDANEAQARQSFRQALCAIRKAVGKQQSIIVDGDSIALAIDAAFVDVAAFEKLAGAHGPAALQQAASLYDGDLLESFDVLPESFGAWLRIERERLRELALQILAKLLAVQRDDGDFDAGIQTAIRMLMLDPLQETVHRSLMQLYASQGRKAAALRQYQSCVDLLQRELGVGPEAATRRVYQDLVQGLPPEPGVPLKASDLVEDAEQPKTPMIGRARELSRLRECLRESESGNGRTVIVSGDAGVGKSRLCEELGSQAIESGFRLLVGRCYETERILPFGAWVSALRSGGVASDTMLLESLRPAWRQELGRLLPEAVDGEAGRTTDHHDHLRLFEAVLHVLGNLSNRVPICVVLEDIPWADEISLSLLCYVSRRVAGRRVMLVGTFREEDLSELLPLRRMLDELGPTARVERLELAPLTQSDTLSLVRVSAGGQGRSLSDLGAGRADLAE
jgi:DNA-binding SARP family transcriptional activator